MKDNIIQFLTQEVKFTFAKTMANIPHAWICRKHHSDDLFLAAMNFIKDNGKAEMFFKTEYIYYTIGEYKYWVMTDKNGFKDKTAIINRAKV
tara:strand:+ start:1087 stop:1362 length:276 start_codon:yes stop_codon:yes gene_type:complete